MCKTTNPVPSQENTRREKAVIIDYESYSFIIHLSVIFPGVLVWVIYESVMMMMMKNSLLFSLKRS